jgi:cyclic beta-1,2-glucan synthetase
MGYPPGVRENGGQYTHGSLWLAMAWARLGEGEAAVRLLEMMNPVQKTATNAAALRYRGEPYVVAADVASATEFAGRAGWTWYTGSAAWMYRVWIEEVLGLQVNGETLRVVPAIPRDWPGYELEYRFRTTRYRIIVQNGAECYSLELDGRAMPGERQVSMVDDGGVHTLVVRITTASSADAEAPALVQAG